MTNYAPAYDLSGIDGLSYIEKLKSIVAKDQSLLLLCLAHLAISGDYSIVPKHRQQALTSQLFLSAENIRFAANPRGSQFCRLMTNAMTVLGKGAENEMLRQFGVCYSHQLEDRNDTTHSEKAKIELLTKMHLSKHCYAILLFDNLGFKNCQGFRKGLGYEQFTV